MADDEARAGKVTSHGTLDFWELRYKVQSEISTSGSGDGVGTYSHGTTGVTDFVPNAAVVTLGMYLYATSAFDGTSGVWQAIYDGPSAPSGGYIVGGSSFETTVSMEVRMKGARLYVMQGGALPRIMWDSLDVYANGVFYVTLGPGVDMVGFGTGPNYVPVLGMPLEVTGGCSAGRAETTPWVYNPCDPDNADGRDWESSAEQTVSGGWQYREYDGGPWIDLPLKAFSDSVPSGSNCPFGIGSPEVAATRTYGTLLEGASSASYAFEYAGKIARTQIDRLMCGPVVVYESGGQASIGPDPCTGEIGPVFQDHYKTTTTSEGKSGTVRLQPDLGPSLERFAEDYAKLHLRGPGFPQTKATLARSCSETSGGVTTGGTFTSNPEVHPAMATFLGLVRDGDHAVLDALDYHSYAPASAGKTQSYSVGYSYPGTVVVQCPSPGAPPTVPCEDDDFVPTWVCEDTTTFPDPEGASESASISFPTSVGYVGNYQGHDEAMPRYLGTWGNPLWHLFDYRRDWYLQGDDAAWAPSEDGLGYWGPIRTQVAYDPALPEDERPGTRIDMIGAPYYDWAHTPIFDAYTGGYPWSGMSRFHVREVGFPATVALTGASDPMLSCPDASCVVISDAGGITLSPSGADPLVIDIDLCRFDCYPYLGLLLAKQVNFPAWSNVGSVTARLLSSFASGSVAIDGGAALAVATDYPLPRGKDGGYAGTWGIDDGALFLIDEGTDVAPGGESAAKMSNPETLAGFQGLRGMQAAVLRITIVPAGSGDVHLDWPVFRRHQGHPEVRWLDGNKAALMWPNGPAVLWGTIDAYVHDEGLYHPPLPKGLGEPNSLADALWFVYSVFECRDGGDVSAYNAEITSWYDSFEVALANVGSADKFSFSMLLPKGDDEKIRFAIAQTIAEVPPMALWPTRSRDGEWMAADAPAMERWDRAQEMKYIVSPMAPLVLQDPAGTPISSADSGPSGWAIAKYVLPLTGAETASYRLDQGGTLYATVHPWHGWFAVLFKDIAKAGIAYAVSRGSSHAVAYLSGGTIQTRHSTNIRPLSFGAEIDSEVSATSLTIAYPLAGEVDPLVYGITQEGLGKVFASSDDGVTLSLVRILGPAMHVALELAIDGVTYAFRLDAGTVYATAWDLQGNTLINDEATNLTGLDDSCFVVRSSVSDDSRLTLVVTCSVSDAMVKKESIDAINWT